MIVYTIDARMICLIYDLSMSYLYIIVKQVSLIVTCEEETALSHAQSTEVKLHVPFLASDSQDSVHYLGWLGLRSIFAKFQESKYWLVVWNIFYLPI